MPIGFVYDPVYQRHDVAGHPENGTRLEAIMRHLEQTGLLAELVEVAPRPASVEELRLVHDDRHITQIREAAPYVVRWLDPDTYVTPDSYQAALYAAGGSLAAVEAVMAGTISGALALVRPPGHHATPWQAMGFCLFNNVALAARYALEKYGLGRVAVIDFDVHHGNGTQTAFIEDPRVLYLSLHESPFYPGTGEANEVGQGAAAGTNVNIPLPAGCGDGEYLAVFQQVVVPVVTRFRPEFIFVSAGYDAHWADPLAMMLVSTDGFSRMVTVIRDLAGDLCDGRLVGCLEGGYDLRALAASVKATFDVWLGNDVVDPLGPSPRESDAPGFEAALARVRQIQGLA
jgi:acetoin utilization deacetylase AcuC-like enzyme